MKKKSILKELLSQSKNKSSILNVHFLLNFNLKKKNPLEHNPMLFNDFKAPLKI